MITNLIKLQDYLNKKTICLLGNSNSILKTPKNIDSYDIICRINKGSPLRKEKFIGSRTDVLFLSTKMEDIDITKNFHPKYVVWINKNSSLQNNWLSQQVIKTSSEDWIEVKEKLTTLPSSGCVSIYFLIKYINFIRLDIYGFDFFKSGTWYHNLKNQPWHNGNLEEKFIKNLITTNQKVQLILD
jgi:hypothetical protein